MGMSIIRDTCVFNITSYGLKVGNVVQAICVGGGGGSNNSAYTGGSMLGYGSGKMGKPGKIETKSVILYDENIPVTVGEYQGPGLNGSSTSFGNQLTALGGEISNNSNVYEYSGYFLSKLGLSLKNPLSTLDVIDSSKGVVILRW